MKAATIVTWGVALAASFTSACSNDSTTSPGSQESAVAVAITDAASQDVAVFEVDVTGIQLQRISGPIVSVLSDPIRVDLASLTDTSNLLASARIPVGTYTKATIALDTTNARCVLTGKSTPATLFDAQGNPLTGTLTVPIQLGSPLLATATAHRLVELDLDIDQSVVADTVGNTVTIEPAFLLRIDPTLPRDIASIGTLSAVDEPNSSFTADVRALGGAIVTNVTFQATSGTVFQIDGVCTTGAAGLTALAALPVGSSIQCYGALAPATDRVDVTFVEAGVGTYEGGTDIVEGHVVGRTGGVGSDAVLEVLGHSNDATHTTFQYATTFLVSTSFANTKVVRRGSAADFDVDDLNIGQHVRVFGTLVGSTMTASTASSVIRMQPTRVFGNAAGAPAGTSLTMALTRVGLQSESAFTWADGGFTPVTPGTFTMDVGALGVGLGINSTSAVSAVGWFSGVGDAGPDFSATSLTNASTAPALFFVRNRLSTGFNVITTANASQIQLGILGTAAIGEVAVVDRGFIGSIPIPTSPVPTVNHPAGTGFYSLRDRGNHTVRVFTRFSDFSSALGSDIAQGATLVQLGAVGTYAQNVNTIDAGLAAAVVE